MIADWSVEVGADSPVIEVPWAGWVDLFWDRNVPNASWHKDRARALPEVTVYPELLKPLELLNSMNHLTSKIDVFPVGREDADPELAEAGLEQTAFGLGGYVDVLTICLDRYRELTHFESIARAVCRALGGVPIGLSSAEIVIRPARFCGHETFGWTLYALGFGLDEAAARQAWARSCGLLAAVFSLEIASANIRYSQAILDRNKAGRSESTASSG